MHMIARYLSLATSFAFFDLAVGNSITTMPFCVSLVHHYQHLVAVLQRLSLFVLQLSYQPLLFHL